MNKTELIQLYAKDGEKTLAQAKADLELLGDIMRAELLAGSEVPIPGVGRLVVRHTGPRKARNPRTGEEINVPAGRKIGFAPSMAMKEALRGDSRSE